jgi:branched-chain amino acid transport system substrate-binding protein
MAAADAPAVPAEPMKFGTSKSLTGGLAPLGEAMLLTEQMWVEQINTRGGLLGRPTQLVFYDDRSSPATDPGIYTKILDVDHADILLGNGTNFVSSIMPIVIQRGKTIMAMFALAVNDRFDYLRYFQIMPCGPSGKDEFSRGFSTSQLSSARFPSTRAESGQSPKFS